jgi:spermidine synthase
MRTEQVSRPHSGSAIWPYAALFFVSGFPALLYQIVWQRALFAIYGVNIETVTIVVTVFMLGLGLGSLAGGRLSKLPGLPILAVFGVIEIGIGLYGAASLALFDWAAIGSAGVSGPVTAALTLCLLLVPTLFMGSTLPLLVEYLVRVTRNVGESVGLLYAVNTFGSAVACFAAALWLMRSFGQSGSVRIAVALNLLTGGCALVFSRFRVKFAAPADADKQFGAAAVRRPALYFPAGIAFAFVTGLVSLTYEMVWYRLYSFGTAGVAYIFALMLGCYLAGIALGSFMVGDVCTRLGADAPVATRRALGNLILWGAVVSFLVGPLTAAAVQRVPTVATLTLVIPAAAMLGAAFPLVSHAVIDPQRGVGRNLSLVYVANVAGSVTGSFVVGFLLMDLLALPWICVGLLILGVTCAGALLRGAGFRPLTRTGLVAAGAALLFSPWLFSHLYEKLLYKQLFRPEMAFRHLVETRSGVVAVDAGGAVFGGGAYDGKFNIDLVHDTNGIYRAFAVVGLHPRPSEALMIGLASGSWAQVIASDTEVKQFTIVEINPGYVQLIPHYPVVASLLRNPKVRIEIDDGRRWLYRYPDRKFDLIVMNTSYSWRANMSSLLSVEFLKMARSRMKPGGIMFYNTTWSSAALRTGATVFPYSLRVGNFLAVSDQPIRVDKARWEALLSHYRIDGKPVFNLADPEQRARLDEVLSLADSVAAPDHPEQEMRMELGASLRARLAGARLITDDNMGDEWIATDPARVPVKE